MGFLDRLQSPVKGAPAGHYDDSRRHGPGMQDATRRELDAIKRQDAARKKGKKK